MTRSSFAALLGGHGFGASVHGFGARVHGFGARVHGFGAKVHGYGARVHGFEAKVHGSGARGHGFGQRFMVLGPFSLFTKLCGGLGACPRSFCQKLRGQSQSRANPRGFGVKP